MTNEVAYASKENLFIVLDIIEKLEIKYFLEGGWAVDVLIGHETRKHRDIDVDFDVKHLELLRNHLIEIGYEVRTDWLPSRIELYHYHYGYIDLHPIFFSEDGSAKQASPDGGWFIFSADFFTTGMIDQRVIPCLTKKAQILFHQGYELRAVDIMDLDSLERFCK